MTEEERLIGMIDCAMEIALENGFDLTGMTAAVIAEDLLTYNCDFEGMDKEVLEKAVEAWKKSKGNGSP